MNTSDNANSVKVPFGANPMDGTSLENAVTVRNVSKRFKLFHNVITGPVKEHLLFWKKHNYYREVVAVRDVSFSLKRGEVVGIVGQNGAGKTTLLKMIAGLLPVDEGTIDVRGKVTALLALGMGVHPEFTGRENIYFGGLLLGMPKEEIAAKEDYIVEFAELGEYIDHPFRTYSSGMRARLLFSISMSIDPDILIIDEALSTGDVYFIQKCQRRIFELCNSGATILFVTHNLKQVEDMCSRSLVMDEGAIIFDGPTRTVLDVYINRIHEKTAAFLQHKTQVDRNNRKFRGTGEAILHDAYFVVNGERTSTVLIGHDCELVIEFEAMKNLEDLTVTLNVLSEKSPTTYCFIQAWDLRTLATSMQTFDVQKGRRKMILKFSNIAIGDGTYECGIQLYPYRPGSRLSYDTSYCSYENFLSFQAVHMSTKIFGRGTLCEVPVQSIEIV